MTTAERGISEGSSSASVISVSSAQRPSSRTPYHPPWVQESHHGALMLGPARLGWAPLHSARLSAAQLSSALDQLESIPAMFYEGSAIGGWRGLRNH
eukprot:gene4651-biopygen9610